MKKHINLIAEWRGARRRKYQLKTCLYASFFSDEKPLYTSMFPTRDITRSIAGYSTLSIAKYSTLSIAEYSTLSIAKYSTQSIAVYSTLSIAGYSTLSIAGYSTLSIAGYKVGYV